MCVLHSQQHYYTTKLETIPPQFAQSIFYLKNESDKLFYIFEKDKTHVSILTPFFHQQGGVFQTHLIKLASFEKKPLFFW